MMLAKIKPMTIYVVIISYILLVFTGLLYGQVQANPDDNIPKGMDKICENDKLVLYIDISSTRFAVKDKSSDAIWYGTPKDVNQDSIANKAYKEIMSSNILVTYVDDTGEKTLNSFTNAVAFNQFNIEKIKDGISIEYLISEKAVDELFIPFVIPYSFMQQEILPNLNENERDEMLLNYNIVSVKDKIIKNYVKRHRIKMYPFIVEEDIYVLIPSRRSALNKEIIHSYLKKTGITDEKIIQLNKKYYDHTSIEKNPCFKLALYITLDEYGLKAEIDMSEIEYDSFDAELKSIAILPYFGAAYLNKEGYILVPDGSGTIIQLNSNKEAYEPLILPVYGGHNIDATKKSNIARQQPVSIAAFGIAYGRKGFSAVVADGDTIASIVAGLAGKNTSYNYVYTRFSYNDYYILENPMNLSRNPQVGKNPYKGKASIMYMFLDSEKANYSGMAEKTREYYEKIGILTNRKERLQAPVSIEIPCAAPVTKRFLGITYNSYEALTTFADMEMILNTLHQAGIKDVNVRLTGWTEGGLFHKYPNDLNPIRNLGKRSSFNSFLKTAQKLNYDLYPDISFTRVYCTIFTALFKAVKDLRGSPLTIHHYNHVTQAANNTRPVSYMLRPIEWKSELINAQKRISSVGFANISISDLGYTLYPDYRRKGSNRQGNLSMARSSINNLTEKEAAIMGLYGNIITADQFDIITDIPLYGSDYVIAKEEVPFLQMVLRGYVGYYGTPVNKTDNKIKHILRSVEYGASGIKYLLTNTDNTKVWELNWNEYRNTIYIDYVDEIAYYYNLIKNFTEKTSDSKIIEHKKEMNNVYSTLYENGIKVYVNYNNYAITVDGLNIDGLSFSVKGE